MASALGAKGVVRWERRPNDMPSRAWWAPFCAQGGKRGWCAGLLAAKRQQVGEAGGKKKVGGGSKRPADLGAPTCVTGRRERKRKSCGGVVKL
jgi:hypothetical protein